MANYVTDPSLLSQLNAATPAESFTPASFGEKYGSIAQSIGQKLGVDPNLVLGQLGLETGWGKSVIPGTNNLGNIKDFSGGGVAARDNMTGSNDRYRAYADPQAFADDYASLLARKYPGVVGAGSDAQKFTSGLAGYAEDPQYAAKVTSAAATAQRANPGLFARVGNAVASAISGTANAATPAYVTDPAILGQLNGTPTAQPRAQSSGDRTLLQQAGDAVSAFGHHVMSPIHGGAQLVENAFNSAVQAVAPNTDFARSVQATVDSDRAALARREQEYQASTPDNVGSYAGAIAGEIAPALVAGGARLIQGGADVAGNLAARFGLGQGGTAAAQLAGRTVASSALGGALAATTPVLNPGNFADQKLQQVGTGLAVGAVAPAAGDLTGAVGSRVGNTLRSLVDPFTSSGVNRIAENSLLRFANGGPTQVNATQLVPGSLPTLAEATGNAGVAGVQRTMRDLQPNAFVQREADNAAARAAQLEATTGTKADIDAASLARDAQAQQALGSVFQNAGQANATPVVQTIDSILSGPGGQRSSVSSTLNRIRNMVVDPQSGAVQSDPNILYQSVRKEIGDLLDQRMANANPAGLQASRELLAVRDELDNAIDGAAPGFKQYLADFASASKPISAMEHLQGLNLTNAEGNITLAKVQNALNGITKQQAKPGSNPAKAVSSQQIDELTALRDDLLRQSNVGKGQSIKTTTAQNLAFQNVLANALPARAANLMGSVGPAGFGSAIGTGLGFAAGGPIGAAAGATIGGGVGKVAGGLLQGRNEAIQNRLIDLLLDPAAGGAALNRAGGSSQQTISNALVNRLLPYLAPATVGAGTAIGTRPALPQTP
ncbi:glucosaminidase domain-containing protein [Burkholderia gladioli]|uniref:glucosaminidase domain-containing protein n=1 Tax=Burkholderia gladioli TaxID=28095 RepID=UPI000BBD3E2A|nr:glucosaminidase domain-containing protein [Burkholderia gladioli]ATF86877.1 hypothetical protein CO712_18755 [Burkholderia gladioli pv. gladioli]